MIASCTLAHLPFRSISRLQHFPYRSYPSPASLPATPVHPFRLIHMSSSSCPLDLTWTVYHRRRRDNLYIAATTPFPSLSSGLLLLITGTTQSSSLCRSLIKKTKNRTRYRVLFLASCGCSLLKLEGENQDGFILGS